MKRISASINSLNLLGLFAVLGTVVILIASCKKPDEGVGDSILPEEDLMNAFQTDTVTLSARTIRLDSMASDFYSNIMVGNYIDDDFGVVKTTGVLQFIPSTSKPRYGNELRVDSVVLSLVYQNASYGKNASMYFNVREVLDTIQYSSRYYTNSSIHTKAANLMMPGMETQDPNPESASVSTSSLRLRLRNSFGLNLLKADTTVLDSRELFKEFFGGLAISSETIDGQVINYIHTDTETRLTVYYANLDGEEEVLNNADFIVSSSNCKAFTLIENQYNGTPLAGISSSNPIDGTQLCYLQSGGGTTVALNISKTKWINDFQGATINRAELVIPYDNSSKYSPINTVLIYYQEDGQSLLSSANTGGIVNVSSGVYRVSLTNHLQKYLSGEIKTDEIIIRPDYVLSEYSNSWSVRRSLLHGPAFNPDDITQNMRLIITYSY